MNRLFALPFLACALILAACTAPTFFSLPISPPGDTVYDDRIIGAWAARIEGVEGDGIAQVVIQPLEADGGKGMLTVTAWIEGVEPSPGRQFSLALYNRVAHASAIGGETYYSVQASDHSPDLMMSLDEAGLHLPPQEKGWHVPEHLARDYWIVKVGISEQGHLWLHFVEIGGNLGPSHETVRDYLETQGQEAVAAETCGRECLTSRADLPPGVLAEMIQTIPDEKLFEIKVGPFTRHDAALPMLEVPWPM